MKKKRLLLIASDFFSYYKLISKEFENQGWEVTYISDRPSTNSLIKIIIRKMRVLLEPYLNYFYRNKIKSLDSFDLVLIIKGEGLSAQFISEIKAKWPQTPVHLYLWDSVTNTPGALANSKVVDRTFSFDPDDCRKFEFKLLPLFYVQKHNLLVAPDLDSEAWDLSFIGSIHGDRLTVINRVRKSLGTQSKMFVFVFFASQLMWIFRKLFDRSFSEFGVNELSLKSLDKTKAIEVFRNSKAVLDVHHQQQSGLTMRTLEVLSLGKKLVTTNESIRTYDFYSPQQILVVDRMNPRIPVEFFDSEPDKNIVDKIKNYELGEWVRRISN